jgi:hypothetical protein
VGAFLLVISVSVTTVASAVVARDAAILTTPMRAAICAICT